MSGASGGGGSLRISSVQAGSINLNGVTSNTATVSAVSNLAQLSYLGGETDQLTNDTGSGRIARSNATTVTATKNTGTGNLTVGFELADYTQ